MMSHLMGRGRDAAHPDRRDVVKGHVQRFPSDDDHRDYPPGLVELAEAIRNFHNRTDRATGWRSDTLIISNTDNWRVANQRRQRVRALVWADPANTAKVYLSPTQMTGDLTGVSRSNAIVIPTSPLEFSHPGALHAMCPAPAAGQTIYVVEEFLE